MIPKETGYVKNLGGTGTGFFVMVDDEYGYIMTNFHVIERALLLPLNIDLKVNTATDWWDYEAEIIGADPVADIALVRIKKKDNESCLKINQYIIQGSPGEEIQKIILMR